MRKHSISQNPSILASEESCQLTWGTTTITICRNIIFKRCWMMEETGDHNLNMPELPEPTPHQPDQLFLPHPAICIGLQLVPFRKQLLKEKHEGRSSYAGFAAKCKWDSLQVDYQSFEREWEQGGAFKIKIQICFKKIPQIFQKYLHS